MSTMTELNQTKASRLKNALTDWREVVLHTNSLLTWDQEWFPGVIAAIVTAFYMAVWYWDPTLVTFVAFSGLFVTMADFLGPKIINQVKYIQINQISIQSIDWFAFRCTVLINGPQSRRENLTKFVKVW